MSLNTTPGDSASDSYASVSEADTYWSARNSTAWAGASTSDKEVALRKAAQYLDSACAGRWIGIKTVPGTNGVGAQARAWPRADGSRTIWNTGYLWPMRDLVDGIFIDTMAIPQGIKDAQCEAALLILNGTDLLAVLTRGGLVKSESKGIGPLRKEIVYQDGDPGVDRYPAIEGPLKPYARSMPGATSGGIQLVRA